MNYEGTISPEAMTALIADYKAASNIRRIEADRLDGLPNREQQASEWRFYAQILGEVADRLDRAVQAERERTTEA